MLKSIVWSLIFPFMIKYFSVKRAVTREEKEKIFKFRYRIYLEELNMHFFSDTHMSHNDLLFDEYDFLENTIILYSGDIDDITGTIRLVCWKKQNLPQDIYEKYCMDEINLSEVNTIGDFRFLQVRHDYRKSLLALTLLTFNYKIVSQYIDYIPDIIMSYCIPGLLPYYLKIGCFVYTSHMLEQIGILQIPLAFTPYDFSYFKQTKSVLYHVAKRYNPFKNKLLKRIPQTKPKNFQSMIYHESFDVTPQILAHYRQNIEDETMKENFDVITTLLKKILILPVIKDTFIVRKDVVDFDMYLLMKGAVGVYVNGVEIAQLKPGSLIGEMSLLHEKHMRFTDVKSLTDIKLLLIPRSVLYTLEKKNSRSANKLLHVLCNNLLEKMIAANKIISEKLDEKK